MELNLSSEVASWSFLHMHTKSGQNDPKYGKIGKNSSSTRDWGQRTYLHSMMTNSDKP